MEKTGQNSEAEDRAQRPTDKDKDKLQHESEVWVVHLSGTRRLKGQTR